jgi:hypothetical protein
LRFICNGAFLVVSAYFDKNAPASAKGLLNNVLIFQEANPIGSVRLFKNILNSEGIRGKVKISHSNHEDCGGVS